MARTPHITLALAVVVACVATVGRVLAPSGLYQNTDECKTMAFTTDMVVNGRWLVPVDDTGAQTLKPPLVNWLAAPAVALGWHTELAHKLPLIASGLGTAAVTAWGSVWFFRRLDDNTEAARHRRLPPDDIDRALARHALPLGVATGAAWLASPESIKQLYFCRPDGVQNLFLAGAFFCLTRAALDAHPKPKPGVLQALGWLSAGLAALAKGPMALLIPAYVVLLSLTQPAQTGNQGRLAILKRSGIAWGVPIMLLIPAAWLIPACIAEPEHIAGTLLGGEVAGRFSTEGEGADPSQIPMNLLRVPAFYFERFPPWSFLAAFGVVLVARRGFVRNALGPTLLWVGLLTAVLVVMAGESGSFNAPAYPALALLSTYALVRMIAQGHKARVGRLAPILATLTLIVAIIVVAREAFFSRAARTGLGDEVTAFAARATELVGDDPVAFLNPDLHNPVQTLMGRHQGGPASPALIANARWLIAPPDFNTAPARITGATTPSDFEPVLHSDGLHRTKAAGRGERRDVPELVLYQRRD